MSIDFNFNKALTKGELNNFYNESTIHIANKFDVVLRGPYVECAIEYLRARSNAVSSEETAINKAKFNRWESNHVEEIAGFKGIKFKWACKDISIPTARIRTQSDANENGLILDTQRNMKYVYSKGYEKHLPLNMTIVEDTSMMWYQFFNALTNTYFSSKVHTARDSIHKMGLDVFPYLNRPKITEYVTPGYNDRRAHDDGPLFEFNSITYSGMGGDIQFSQSASEGQTYSVSFVVPNPFQGVFKEDRKGMTNTVNDDVYIYKNGYTYKGITTDDVYLKDDSRSPYVNGNYSYLFADKTRNNQ